MEIEDESWFPPHLTEAGKAACRLLGRETVEKIFADVYNRAFGSSRRIAMTKIQRLRSAAMFLHELSELEKDQNKVQLANQLIEIANRLDDLMRVVGEKSIADE